VEHKVNGDRDIFLHLAGIIASGSQGRLVDAVISCELLIAFYYQSFTATTFLLISLFIISICMFQLMTWDFWISKGSRLLLQCGLPQKC